MRGNAMGVLDEATKELFQGMVDEVDEVFVDSVARFRGISKKAVHKKNGSGCMGRHDFDNGLCTEHPFKTQAWNKHERTKRIEGKEVVRIVQYGGPHYTT